MTNFVTFCQLISGHEPPSRLYAECRLRSRKLTPADVEELWKKIASVAGMDVY